MEVYFGGKRYGFFLDFGLEDKDKEYTPMYVTCWQDNTWIPSVFQIASVFQRKAGLKVPMDLFTLIPRTIIGVTYPAFASLKAVLSDSPESCGAWLRKMIHTAFS